MARSVILNLHIICEKRSEKMNNSFIYISLLLCLSTVSSPHHQRPYENLQHLIGPDNLYDEPLVLPSKHKYPTRFFDERRLSKRGVNKNIMR